MFSTQIDHPVTVTTPPRSDCLTSDSHRNRNPWSPDSSGMSSHLLLLNFILDELKCALQLSAVCLDLLATTVSWPLFHDQKQRHGFQQVAASGIMWKISECSVETRAAHRSNNNYCYLNTTESSHPEWCSCRKAPHTIWHACNQGLVTDPSKSRTGKQRRSTSEDAQSPGCCPPFSISPACLFSLCLWCRFNSSILNKLIARHTFN